MLRNNYAQRVLCAAWLGLSSAFLATAASAQVMAAFEIDPPIQTILVGAAPAEVFIQSRDKGERLTYQWELDGPGELTGELTGPAIFYLPPPRLEQKAAEAIITVTITDAARRATARQLWLQLLDPHAPAAGRNFKLTVTMSQPRYHLGETMHITVAGEHDCLVWLIHQDAQGQRRILFPLKPQTDNYLRAGQARTIPDAQQNFELIASEPTGRETITAIGYSGGPEYLEGRRRGVQTLKTEETLGEAVTEYEIVP